MEPAASIIKMLGGVRIVADVLNVHRTAPVHWTRPRDKHGTDGRVPQRHIEPLIRYARSQGIALGPEDFYPAAVTIPRRSRENAA
jgi:hypothetical protein